MTKGNIIPREERRVLMLYIQQMREVRKTSSMFILCIYSSMSPPLLVIWVHGMVLKVGGVKHYTRKRE
jgi:hypothetical protein